MEAKQTKQLSIKANTLCNAFGSVFYLGCQWLLTVIVVRVSSGFDDAGILALAMAIGNIFIPFAMYRMRTIQVSDVNHDYSQDEYFGFRIITVTLSLVFCVLYSLVTCSAWQILPVFLYLVYKAIESIIDVFHGVDQINRRMDYICVSFILRGALSILSFTLVLFFLHDISLALGVMIVVTLPVGILYDWRKARQFGPLVPRISFGRAKELLFVCLPAVLANILCSAVLTVPRQYLGLVWGDASLGIYASIAAPVAVVQMGGSYIYNPVLSELALLYAKKDKSDFKKMFAHTVILMLSVSSLLALGLFFTGEWLFGLVFGEKIVEYLYLLPPLLVCAVITIMLWFANDMLLLFRMFRETFVANLLAFLASLLMMYYFVNAFEGNGVSFTGISAYIFALIVSVILVKISLKRNKGIENE